MGICKTEKKKGEGTRGSDKGKIQNNPQGRESMRGKPLVRRSGKKSQKTKNARRDVGEKGGPLPSTPIMISEKQNREKRSNGATKKRALLQTIGPKAFDLREKNFAHKLEKRLGGIEEPLLLKREKRDCCECGGVHQIAKNGREGGSKKKIDEEPPQARKGLFYRLQKSKKSKKLQRGRNHQKK